MAKERVTANAGHDETDPVEDTAIEIYDADDAPGLGRYGFPRGMRPWREGAAVCVIVGIIVAVVYQVWHLHPSIPIAYNGDGTLNAMMTKSIRENGWMLNTPRLGAPFHGTLYDFPQGGENAQFLVEKLIGYVTPNYGVTLNAFFFLTFFLDALSAYFTARYLKVRPAAALVIATFYTILPYHLWHGEIHATRAGYYIVPPVVLVMLWLIDYRTRYCEEGHLALSRWRWRFVAAIAICLMLGGSDTQNSLFAVCLLASIGVLLTLVHWDARPLAIAAALCLAIMGSLAVNNLPTVLYQHDHGGNSVVAKRTIDDVDIYSLSFSRMLLPNDGYRVSRLARLEVRASTKGAIPGEAGEALGTVGAIGLLLALGIAGLRIFRADPGSDEESDGDERTGPFRTRVEPMLGRLGGMSLLAILFAMTGGISSLLALAGFTSLRTWNRIVVFIGFFALLAVGFVLDLGLRRLHARRGRTSLLITAAIVLVAIGFGTFDQTSKLNVPTYTATARQYNSDDAFFTTLEQRLPHAAMVFQYPIMTFPEDNPSGDLYTSDQLIGYLHTKDLRWSYGAMDGRPESNWQQALNGLPTRTAMYGLAAAGFAGVYINRAGYTTAGPAFETSVRSLLGNPMLTSADNELVYYDLTPIRRALDQQLDAAARRALRAAILYPTTSRPGSGFYPREINAQGSWQWAQQNAQIVLDNPNSKPEPIRFAAALSGGNGTVTIDGLGPPRTLPLDAQPAPFTAALDIPPGTTTVRFHTNAPQIQAPGDVRVLFLQLWNFSVRPPAIERALCRFEPAGPTRPADCPA